MSVLLRASEVMKLSVVTFAGEDVAKVKDIVYAAGGGQVGGFTLNGTGLFAGPLKSSLPWAHVAGLGPAAVMIEDEDRLADRDAVFAPEPVAINADLPDVEAGEGTHAVELTPPPPVVDAGDAGNVLGSRVLTDAGVDLGKVVDVVLQVTGDGGAGSLHADVVGYEIESSEALAGAAKPGKKVLIPLPDTISASAEHLIVPASTRDFVGHDLSGFGAAVLAFRAQLEGSR